MFIEPDDAVHVHEYHSGSCAKMFTEDDAIHVHEHHSGPLYTIACSPTDTGLVACGGGDNLVSLWRIGCENSVNKFVGHKDSISSVAFSKDGQLLASGGVDSCIKIWDMSGNIKCTFDGSEGKEFEWVKWHPNAHLVLAGCTDASVWMLNADKSAVLGVFCGHRGAVTCGDFTPNGKSICTGSLDGTFRIWNPRTGESSVAIGHRKASALTCMTYTSDSTHALTGSEKGFFSVVKISSSKVIRTLSLHSSSIHCTGLSSSKPWAATGGADHKLIIWDMNRFADRSIIQYQAEISCLKWLGDTHLVALGFSDGQIIICDSRTEENVKIFQTHSKKISELDVSTCNNFLVSASEDGIAHVFDISKFR